MSENQPSHTSRTMALIKALEKDREAITSLSMSVLGGAGAPIFPLDFMALAAVKRNVSTSKAICLMVETWNMVTARTLLRVQIDTSLRFSAAWLVQDPHDFATRVLRGERIDAMKDRDGVKLRDKHLVTIRSADYPWLPGVYDNLCGYVHFSGAHITDSVSSLDEEDGSIQFLVSETDEKFPEFSWNEVLECSREATEMLATFVHGYGTTKKMSPSELEAARSARQSNEAGDPL